MIANPPQKPFDILIVDDDREFCSSLELLLEPEGARIEIAHTCQEGLSKIDQTYTLVLVNLDFPASAGSNFAQFVRDEYPDTPVIIVTGQATLDTALQALRHGCADYIQKPYDPDYLCQAVKKIGCPRETERKPINGEQHYPYLVDNMPSGVAVYQPVADGKDFVFVNFNATAEKIESISRVELIGKRVTEVFPGVEDFGLLEVFKRVWQTGTAEHFPIAQYQDQRITGWRDNYVYRLDSGEVVSIYNDVTAQKQAEQALQNAYDIINKSPAVVFLWKNANEWPVDYVSENAENIFGYSSAEFLSGEISYADIIHPDDLEKVVREVTDFSGQEDCFSFEHETYRIINKQGQVRYLDDMTHIQRDDKGSITHYQGVVIDVTERCILQKKQKMLEQQLQRARQMEAVGLMSGGIAHDFNNLLSVITGYIELAKVTTSGETPCAKYLGNALKSSHEAANLVNNFLLMSSGINLEPSKVSFADVLNEAAIMLKETGVAVESSLPDNLWPVMIDRQKIEQVLQHILLNAKEAMPDGGLIKISGENLALENEVTIQEALLLKGQYIHIDMRDTGKGIPKDKLSKIFDPYYSTKQRGVQKGMGLGLSVAYSVVKKHGGKIFVESQEGTGTTVHIYLPTTATGG
ncbi:MAG: ATP-binding protein [Thermodesulfobacteriota bacterium]